MLSTPGMQGDMFVGRGVRGALHDLGLQRICLDFRRPTAPTPSPNPNSKTVSRVRLALNRE